MKKQKKQSEKKELIENSQSNLDKYISMPYEKMDNLRLDELSAEHIETFAENWRLISLIETGLSIKEAKKKLGIKRSERSIRDLRNRFKRHGQKGLIDKRWLRATESFVLTPEVKSIVLGAYYTYSAAGLRLVWKITCEECRNRQLQEPSESSVKKYGSEQKVMLKQFLTLQIVMSDKIFDGFFVKPIAL